MENEKEYGLIYVLTNDYMPNIVKIGKTTKETIEERLRALYYGNTGVPVNFKCVRSYRVPLDKLDLVEKKLHAYFTEQRINPNREFFKIEPNEVDKLFFIYNEVVGSDTAEVQTVIDGVTAEDDIKEAKRKSPNMDFFKMGFDIGDKLIFTRDKGISCTIISNKKVAYNGQEYSLTKLTHQFIESKYIMRPAPYWETEDGRPLTTLYIEYVKKEASEVKEQNTNTAKSAADVIAQCDELINAKP